MLKRILIVASCVALLVCVLVLPVSAAVDYNDYISNVVVDGSNDLVTCTIPANDVHWSVVRSDVSYFSGEGSTFVTFQPVPSMALTDIYSSWFYNDPLIISNIPNETVISGLFDLRLNFSPNSNANTEFQQSFVIHYLDSSSQHISYDVIVSDRVTIPSSGVSGFNINLPFDYILDKPDGAALAYFETRFYFYSGHTGSVSISGYVSDLTMNMSISSLYRLQQETGKTNVILTEVQKQLADQGKTLDDVLGAQQDTNDKLDGIINDKVDPSLPSGSDIVGDLDDAEGQIRDDAQSGLDQGASVQQSAIHVLGQYLSAFACVSWIFDRFSTIPFVSGLLALSFSLGITGAILGIGLSIFNSYSAASRSRSERSSRASRSSRSKGG